MPLEPRICVCECKRYVVDSPFVVLICITVSTSALADEKEAAPSPSPDQDKPKDDAKPATLMEQLNQFVDGLKETWDTLYFVRRPATTVNQRLLPFDCCRR